MTTPTENAVLAALRAVRDPDQGQDIVSLGLVKELHVHDAEVSFTLAFAGQSPATKAALHSSASKAISQLPGVSRVSVKMGSAAGAGRPQAPPAQGHAHGAPGAPAATDSIPQLNHTIAGAPAKGAVATC